jgi:hypothetical protein
MLSKAVECLVQQKELDMSNDYLIHQKPAVDVETTSNDNLIHQKPAVEELAPNDSPSAFGCLSPSVLMHLEQLISKVIVINCLQRPERHPECVFQCIIIQDMV